MVLLGFLDTADFVDEVAAPGLDVEVLVWSGRTVTGGLTVHSPRGGAATRAHSIYSTVFTR